MKLLGEGEMCQSGVLFMDMGETLALQKETGTGVALATGMTKGSEEKKQCYRGA